MKITKIALITLALTVPVQIHAQEQHATTARGKGKAEKYGNLTPLQKAREISRIKGSRKIEIKPIKQTDGIKTGIIIAYGHLIPPPYKVESIDGKVFVNGVQVVPSLVAQRNVKAVEIPADRRARYRKMIQFEKEVEKKYYSQVILKDRTQLQAEILAFVKQNDLVKDAHWGKDMIVIDYKVGGGTMLTLRGTTPTTVGPLKKDESTDAAIQYITKGIESGCLIIDSDGGVYPHCGDRKSVREIMLDDKLAKDEKIERLAKWGNSYEAAMDIADNYNMQEWK